MPDKSFRIRQLLILYKGTAAQKASAREEVVARARSFLKAPEPVHKTDRKGHGTPTRRRGKRKRSHTSETGQSPALPRLASSTSLALSHQYSPACPSSSSSDLTSLSSPSSFSASDYASPAPPRKRKRPNHIPASTPKSNTNKASPIKGSKKKGQRSRRGGQGPPPCLACRHLKVLCDRGTPCSRCVKFGRECAYPQPPQRSLGRALTPTARRRMKKRAKLARSWGHGDGGEGELGDDGDSDTDSAEERLPKPKTKPSIPLAFKKPKRRHVGSTRTANVDNALLAKLGLAPLPQLQSPATATGKARSKRAEPQDDYGAGKSSIGKASRMAEVANTSALSLSDKTTGPSHVKGRRRGIRSSTFAAVIRLVAHLCPNSPPQPTRRCSAPSKPPPVWAQVRATPQLYPEY